MAFGARTEMENIGLEQLVENVLAPLLQADGGEVYVVRCDSELVRLHLMGRFSGCPGNTLVTRNVIEPAVHRVSPETAVQISSGAIIPEGARRLEPR